MLTHLSSFNQTHTQEAIEKGLKANDWVQQLIPVMESGKGGGKEQSAQASGSCDDLDVLEELALKFAKTKLDIS